jgi:hypothetical protein
VGTVKRWRRRLSWKIRQAHRLMNVIRHWREAYHLLETEQRHRQRAEELRVALEWPEPVTFLTRTNIRWAYALRVAKRHGIEFVLPGAGMQFCASLPREKWAHDIDPEADPVWYADWLLREPEDTKAISAWADWPEIAIAQCVLNAKKAGVI